MAQLRLTRPANDICEQYSAILLRTARERLGTRAKREKEGYDWWSPALDRMRNEVYCARRKWQASRRAGGDREKALHDHLRATRIRYKLAMKDAELAFFRSVAESGNTDPWGLAYRTASGRFRPPLNVLNGVKLADGCTRTTGDTMLGLVNVLCPDDNLSRDTVYHRQVRIAAACAPSGTDATPPTKEQVGLIIRELPNTAPGIDGITAKIVRQAWRVTGDEIWHMFRACIAEGVFPDLWKMGKLVVLPKGGDRPLTDPKAYRPITLLPVLGKILERVIISCAPCLYRGISDAQHGFTRGRSTVTALNTINQIANGSTENYVQLIFLDISGAFDNAWWPMVLLKAKQCGVPPNIYRILTSYFINRRVGLFAGNRVVWKVSTMGCPQGSVLGPTLWNLLLDDLLKLPKPEGVHFVAYADDVTIVVEASSRSAIERKAADTIAAVSEWSIRNRLGFSAGKSQTMTYKGKFKRGPIIKMDGAAITSVSQAKALGIVLDEARSYVQQALYIGEKAAACFGKMSRLSSSTWGIRFHALRVLYSGTYVATLTYAAAVWYRRSSLHVIRSVLMRTQRPALILLTKAYRTASNAALPVLAGVLPADLEVFRAGRVDEEGTGLVDKERRKKKKEMMAAVVAIWQDRWDSSQDGRDLYKFFPDITERLFFRWVEPDYAVSQILVGHGCFNERLLKFNLRNSGLCPCGSALENRDHALWDCELYVEERNALLDSLKRTAIGPVYFRDLVCCEHNFKELRRFAHAWHHKRKQYEE